MTFEWKEVPLGDVYTFSSGLSKPRSDFGFGYPFLSFKDVFYNSSVPMNLSELVKSTPKEREQCSVRKGDVFLTRTSETMDELGMSCVSLVDIPDATFNGFTKRLRPKQESNIEPEYARYYFRSPKFRSDVTAMSSMSTRASLNNEMLSRLKIVLPPLDEQKAIGNILGSLDDKIELNRRMNATLEAMAQAIFKSWFVDFDPVRAKAKGSPPHGMDAETAALFPSEFVESELGMIPNGWRITSLQRLGDISSGKRPQERADSPSEECEIPLYGGAGIMGYVRAPLYSAPIIVTGRVGTLGIIHRISGPIWPSDNTIVIKPHSESHLDFLYMSLQRFPLAEMNRGSTQPLLTQKEIGRLAFIAPSSELLVFFSKISNVYFTKIKTNFDEIEKLTGLRDTLLPRLISGQLRIPDVEAVAQNVL